MGDSGEERQRKTVAGVKGYDCVGMGLYFPESELSENSALAVIISGKTHIGAGNGKRCQTNAERNAAQNTGNRRERNRLRSGCDVVLIHCLSQGVLDRFVLLIWVILSERNHFVINAGIFS